jgi:hypothetical protein
VLIQYKTGNHFIGLVIIAVIIALIISSRRFNLILFGGTCLLLVFFTTSSRFTLIDLAIIYKDVIQDFVQIKQDLNKPNSGLEVLPSQVQQINSILKNNNIQNYRLSKKLSDDLILQRTIESVWPIKLEIDSPYLFYLFGEPDIDPACNEIERSEDVILAFCH